MLKTQLLTATLLVTVLLSSFISCSASAANCDEAFLDEIQAAAFQYFWHECGTNGLIQDRMTDQALSSTMAAGFQLPVLCIGAERGWVTREEAAERVLTILKTYAALPRFHGMFAHYYNIQTGEVVPLMHKEDDGADVSETGFMMAGVITCRQYFNKDNPVERQIRKLATDLYEAVEWDWMLQDGAGNLHKTLAWHWSPNHGFAIGQRVKSTMELSSMVTYLLAIGSPTHPIPPECWNEGWTKNYVWMDYEGNELVACPPLFAHQYPQTWYDLRNMKDKQVDYHRNAIIAIRANREYCRTKLYPDHDLWGLTYCDGPNGYGIYGYPPKRGKIDEDAVIPPTGAGGSIVFTPSESISCLKYIYNNFHDKMWGPYGLYDAMSPKHNWFFEDYVAIDEGPIVMMIENFRSGLVWDYFMKDPAVLSGLSKAGFVTVLDDFEEHRNLQPYCLWETSPNHAHTLTAESVKAGDRALRVSYTRSEVTQGGLVGHPAQKDFSRNKYLSLWVKDLDDLTVKLTDTQQRELALTPVGFIKGDDGWSQHSFELPSSVRFDLKQVESFTIEAEPNSREANGQFYLDEITLTRKADLRPPAPVEIASLMPTRMPGEVLLAWNPTGDDELEGRPYRYDIRYSTRPIRDYDSFARAPQIVGDERSVIGGSETNLFITGLSPGYTYHFAITAEDLAGNRSGLRKSTALSLPSERVSSEFDLDDFERDDEGAAQIQWHGSSPNIKVTISDEQRLRGSGALKIEYKKEGERDKWSHVIADLDIRNLSHHKYLSMWVSGKARILLKVLRTESDQEEVETQTSALADGWSPLYFDLSELKTIDRTAIRQILLFIEPGETNVSGTIYIDEMKLTMQRN